MSTEEPDLAACRFDAAHLTKQKKTAGPEDVLSRLTALCDLRHAAPDVQRTALCRTIRAIRVNTDSIWIDLNAKPPDSSDDG